MTSGNVIGMELVAKNAVMKWRELLGPTNTQVLKLILDCKIIST